MEKQSEVHEQKNEHVHQHEIEHNVHHYKKHKKESVVTKPVMALIAIAILVVLFNQFQINSVSGLIGGGSLKSSSSRVSLLSGNKAISDINVDELQSTAQTVQAVFQLDGLDGGGVMSEMFPTGTPDYGAELGVSFDEPVESLAVLAKMYPALKAEVEKNNPEGFNRFMNLASKPVGISCEYCCGLKAIGIKSNGDSSCGCQHNPALLSIAVYLSAYTDYSDGEILREVMKWKTLFFPKDMIELGTSLAGGDTSVLNELPGMVGGC